ncbi:hypothetical protein RIF29_32958 [Crotalaria pallida]|uniref:Uncharacterized protein n=1 Tax=Crotalaria pallida TaxID=3830 RepID=A0AAN9E9F7_CROPI
MVTEEMMLALGLLVIVGGRFHTVVLGTINVGEQGEGAVPDLSGVIGAVLNSIGIGGQSRNIVSNAIQTSSVCITFGLKG